MRFPAPRASRGRREPRLRKVPGSEDVVDVESGVSEWEAPLANFKAEVEATRAELVEALNEMDDVMRRRQECADQRATLELMTDVNNLVTKSSDSSTSSTPPPPGPPGPPGPPRTPSETDGPLRPTAGPTPTPTRGNVGRVGVKRRRNQAARTRGGLDALRPRLEGGDAAPRSRSPTRTISEAPARGRRGRRGGSRARTIVPRLRRRMQVPAILLSKGERLAFVRALGPRIEACETRLAAALRRRHGRRRRL